MLIAAAGLLAGAGLISMTALAAAALHATWQLSQLDIADSRRCLVLFRSNRDFGLIIFAGAVIDSLIKGSAFL